MSDYDIRAIVGWLVVVELVAAGAGTRSNFPKIHRSRWINTITKSAAGTSSTYLEMLDEDPVLSEVLDDLDHLADVLVGRQLQGSHGHLFAQVFIGLL